jgi:hypothetical protein
MESTEQNVEEVTMDGSIDAVANSLLSSLEPEPKKAKPVEEAIDDAEAEQPEESEEIEEELDENESSDDSGDDEEEAVGKEAEPENEDSKELFTVKVDGQEQEVTLDDLKRSFSGQAYIQKGMQETAQQKKQSDEMYQALLNEREQVLKMFNEVQSGQSISAPKPPNQELLKRNPVGYMREKAQYDNDVVKYNEQQQNLQKIKEQQDYLYSQSRSQRLSESAEILKQKVPDFGVPEKAEKLTKDMMEYATYRGYSPQDIDNILEARDVLTLLDATKWRKLQKSRSKADKKVQNARPMVKAGAKKSSQTGSLKQKEQAVSRMKKTGSIDDVANFLIS